MKRVFDIIFSMVAIAIFSIPITIICVLIRLFETDSILFKQERIGKNKTKFLILKLRTLKDEKPTPIGKILRKTGLDELPQFINVLKGDMSIVGPRALTEFDIERLKWNDDFHNSRWDVKPGITGLAQLYGGQNKKTSWFWDMKYLDRANVFWDFSIVVLSFLINLFGKTKIRRIVFSNKRLN